jgi:hypothetical protein
MNDVKALTKSVRLILLKDWDPIGIADEPRAQDEYDSYAPAIARMVLDAASQAALADHLLAIETGRMELPGDERRARVVATSLLALVNG